MATRASGTTSWFAWYPVRAMLVLDPSAAHPTENWDGRPALRWVFWRRVRCHRLVDSTLYEIGARPETEQEYLNRIAW